MIQSDGCNILKHFITSNIKGWTILKTMWMIIGLMYGTEKIYSQDFNYSDTLLKKRNIIHLLGYSRVIKCFYQPAILTSDIYLPFVYYQGGIQLKQWGLSIGCYVLIVNKNKFKTALKSHLIMGGNYTEHFTANNFSSRIGIISGWYSVRWFFAGEISSILPIISNVHFKNEYYRNLYSNTPADEWYHPTSVGFFFGTLFGYTIKQRSDIILRFDIPFYQIINFNDNLISFFMFQVNYRFPKQIG